MIQNTIILILFLF